MIGKTFLHYKIVSRLGGGGMGVVYKAHDKKLNRTVALKFLPHHLGQTDAQRERFLREAQAASALDHPNICTIYDIDETGDGQTFIAMRYCEGESLEAVISRGALPVEKAVDIAMKVASGLYSAHGKGIVHRDIKPANIIVTGDGGVKIIDFGLAKLAGQATLTRDGGTVGTAGYMSPEQAQGARVDHRTDIWSLGVVLYEMIAGVRPFSGDHEAAVIYCILNEEPAPVVSLRGETPEALAAVVDRAMAKDPVDRFASMDEFRAALEAAVSGTPAADTQDVDPSTPLGRARQAFAGQNWPEAFAAFGEADSQVELEAEDLDRWATTALWMNRIDVSIAARERALARYVKTGRPARAARAAIELAEDNYLKGARSVCNGWVTRAGKLLENNPDAVENGYLTRFKARIAIEADGDLDTALDLASKTFEIGNRHDNADLRALARQDQGRVLVMKNEIKAGMALLDEAMAMAISGELSPLVVGTTYCNMISICEKIADFRRAGEWSDQAVRWCEPHGDSPFPGICSVHRAEVMSVRGDWDEAEIEAGRAAGNSDGYSSSIAAEAYYVMGEIKLRRGEFREAEASFKEAHRLGRHPAPGMALLRSAQGQTDAARSLIDRALSRSSVDLDRIWLLPAGVEIALAGGDVKTARSRADELKAIADKLESTVFSAHADYAAGIVALAEGDAEAALPLLTDARKNWHAADMPLEEARARASLATAYWGEGETDLAELEAFAARAAFERLGAIPDLERIDALIADNS